MFLKRLYTIPDGWEKTVNDAGDCINPPPCIGVEIKRTGHSRAWHPSERLVRRGILEGWIELSRDEKTGPMLTLKGANASLHFSVLRGPGKYPVSLPTADDPGYEVIHYFECVMDEAEHAAFAVQKGKV